MKKISKKVIIPVLVGAAVVAIVGIVSALIPDETESATSSLPEPTSTVSSTVTVISPDVPAQIEDEIIVSSQGEAQRAPEVNIEEEQTESQAPTIGDIPIDRDNVVLPNTNEPEDEGR